MYNFSSPQPEPILRAQAINTADKQVRLTPKADRHSGPAIVFVASAEATVVDAVIEKFKHHFWDEVQSQVTTDQPDPRFQGMTVGYAFTGSRPPSFPLEDVRLSAAQSAVLVIAMLLWLAIHSGLLKWVVIAALCDWIFG